MTALAVWAQYQKCVCCNLNKSDTSAKLYEQSRYIVAVIFDVVVLRYTKRRLVLVSYEVQNL